MCAFNVFGETRHVSRNLATNKIVNRVLYVDWGSRFVGEVNWGSVVGTGLSGPTLSIL
jgi:hypothetical protein